MLTITESPREAIQSFHRVLSTEEKIKYIQILIFAGFDIIDAGSIVSVKYVPQMADILDVINGLDLKTSETKLMILTPTLKGAETVAANEKISILSFPFSVSPTFHKKNINKTLEESRDELRKMKEVATKYGKELIIYVPMAFGNPYSDPWDIEILLDHLEFLKNLGTYGVYLSNVSIPVKEEVIGAVFKTIIPFYPNMEFGLHLHTNQSNWKAQVNAAFEAGCRNYDSVLTGLGGCPMSDDLLGNLDTDLLLDFIKSKGIQTKIDRVILNEARSMAAKIFST